jgi:hypothetical protein
MGEKSIDKYWECFRENSNETQCWNFPGENLLKDIMGIVPSYHDISK